VTCPPTVTDEATDPSVDRRVVCRMLRDLARPTFEDPADTAVVGTGELDDDRSHLGVFGPRRVGDVGRPEDRLPRGDPRLLLAYPDPAAALDHDQPGRIRVRVRLDTGAAGEGELGDESAGVRVDRLAGDPARPGRTIRTAVPDAEPADLDGHRSRYPA
jgi:hypothetical protein